MASSCFTKDQDGHALLAAGARIGRRSPGTVERRMAGPQNAEWLCVYAEGWGSWGFPGDWSFPGQLQLYCSAGFNWGFLGFVLYCGSGGSCKAGCRVAKIGRDGVGGE